MALSGRRLWWFAMLGATLALFMSARVGAQSDHRFSLYQIYWNGGPLSSALPARYAFSRLLSDLWWSGAQLPPLSVVAAHEQYCHTVDAASIAAIPTMLQLRNEDPDGRALNLTEDDRNRYRTHLRRMDAVAESAEAQLWNDLASAASGNEAAELAVQQARGRRKVDAQVERVLRRASIIRDRGLLPPDIGAYVRVILESDELPPETRAAIMAGFDKGAGARAIAWKAVEPAVAAAVDFTFARQLHLNEIGLNSPMRQELFSVQAAERARVIAAEWAAAQGAMAAMPQGIRARVHREACLGLLTSGRQGGRIVSFPKVGRLVPSSVHQLATSVLAIGAFDDATRDAMRATLASWMAADEQLAARAVNDEIARLASVPPKAATDPEAAMGEREDPNPFESVAGARQELARAKLAELSAATGLDWSKPEVEVPNPEVRSALSAADHAVVGKPSARYLPGRSELEHSEVRKNVAAMPRAWRLNERQHVIEQLGLAEAELAVAHQVLADADAAWAERVAPLLVVEGVAGDELAANRRAAWREASAIEDAMIASLLSAFASPSTGARARLAMAALARQETQFFANGRLFPASFKSPQSGIARSALEFRGSPEERDAVVASVAAHAPEIRAALQSYREFSLHVVDAAERTTADQNAARTGGRDEMSESEAASRAKNWQRHAELIAAQRKQVESRQRELIAAIVADLPSELGARWQRARRAAAATTRHGDSDERRSDLEWAFAQQPGTEAFLRILDAESTPVLDACDVWVCATLDELARREPPIPEVVAGQQDERLQEHNGYLRVLLLPGCADRMNHALFRVAHALPPEAIALAPSLRCYLRN